MNKKIKSKMLKPTRRAMKHLESQIDSIDGKIKSLKETRSVFSLALAVSSCPYGLGDVVSCNGTSWEITEILPKNFGDRYELKGARLKKDGTVGKVIGRVYGWGNIKLISKKD